MRRLTDHGIAIHCRCATGGNVQLRPAEGTQRVWKSTSEGQAAATLAQLGDNINSDETEKNGASVTSTGADLPALTKKLLDRIRLGQYVYFVDLPPDKGCTWQVPAIEDGQITVIRAEYVNGTRKMILDLATWVQCFALCMAMITEADPSCIKSLLVYMTTIAKASMKYKWMSWVVYDQNYRQEAADSGITDWSKVDPSTYTQCFANAAISSENWCRFCQSINHTSEVCPSHSFTRKRAADFLNGNCVQSTAKKETSPHSHVSCITSAVATASLVNCASTNTSVTAVVPTAILGVDAPSKRRMCDAQAVSRTADINYSHACS